MKLNHKKYIKLPLISIAFVFALSSGVLLPSTLARADRLDDINQQINALQNQINDYNSRSSDLAAQSNTLQGKIAELQNQQAQIQAQIDLSTAEREKLETQISDKQTDIKKKADALSVNLENMYYTNRTSLLDILMNSKSVSDYVDKQVRQNTANDQVGKSVEELVKMRRQLEKQKSEVETLIARQNSQKADLAASQAEQQKLLDDTQGQEEKYRQLTEDSNRKIADLQNQQREEICRRTKACGSGTACGGGYPTEWCTKPKDAGIDSWGMYTRECVSYAAFRVNQSYGWPAYWTRGDNNAKQWPGKADAYGIPRGSTPKVGSVAVMTSGYYGHVAWVEAVNGNSITISDYNSDLAGNYNHYETSASAFDTYIYFDQAPKN